ncbi:GNAT family N-acetyltransferase [Gloeobacter violaceus]|nr:GNAT family N-acetyltransferase [Gloeobacter violaceus]
MDPLACVLETPRLLLSVPGPDFAPRFAAFYRHNREHLATWDPPYPPQFYTEEHWRTKLADEQANYLAGTQLRLVLLARAAPDEPLVGFCNFSQIVRKAFQACYLGYSLDKQAVGRGLMSEGLAEAIAYVFGTLGLHRIMANYLPTNVRSGRLLRRLGFVVEGYARNYLFIDGQWRDHILTSLTNPAPADPQL